MLRADARRPDDHETQRATPENRLGRETSPYLLQHKDNPVHWWAWGPEALAEAKRTGKPILLSVGYAACHWCHVMAHESFEDAATAAEMNELFVNIKVDREERPDIDAIYMRALHSLGEQGGWPLTMFLDSEARPFWGGTYFPPEPRFGRPSFRNVLREVARIYREEPDKVAHNAGLLVQALVGARAGGAAPHLSTTPRSATSPRAWSARSTWPAAGSPARRSSRSGASSGCCGAAPSATATISALQCRRCHAHQHLPGRHLRSSGRRLCPLLGRRALAGAALREDALRQCPADRPDVRGLARDRQRALQGAASRRRWDGSSAR